MVRRPLSWVGLVIAMCCTTGCNDTSQPLPAGATDPGTVQNAAGARGMALAARGQFQFALADYIPMAGLLTDELEANTRGPAVVQGATPDPLVQIDARLLAQPTTIASYSLLQHTRALSMNADGALAKYAGVTARPLRGELQAMIGYSEILLADLFCSGVPLSTFDFESDFTFKAGSTTDDVYRDAITHLDSAQSLAADSALVLNFARVAKGRALLALGQYADAAAAVTDVPADFRFVVLMRACTQDVQEIACANPPGTIAPFLVLPQVASESDREGASGLPYRSNGDPRTASTIMGTSTTGNFVYTANTLLTETADAFLDVDTLVLASGVEAQLIRAEAALQAGQVEQWRSTLNALRAADSRTTSLPDITDPGTPAARIDTMFAERAAWLFLTGTRQGDMRRLVRKYHRTQSAVYPHGAYPGVAIYGNNIDAPIPNDELNNPLFQGCLTRD